MHCTTTTPYVSQALPCESKLSIESDVKVYWGDECETALSGVIDRQLRHVSRGAFLKPLGSGSRLPGETERALGVRHFAVGILWKESCVW